MAKYVNGKKVAEPITKPIIISVYENEGLVEKVTTGGFLGTIDLTQDGKTFSGTGKAKGGSYPVVITVDSLGVVPPQKEYRGNDYAGKACRLVFEIAKRHGMPFVMISCRADNLPSRRTLEKLGGTLLETRVPASYSSLYRIGEHDPHCYFRFDL